MLDRLLRQAAVSTAAATAFGMATGVSPAAADPWGTGTEDTGPPPDNREHTYCWDGTFPLDLRDNVNGRMTFMDDATVMWDTFMATCSTNTDTVWFQRDLPGDIRGQFECVRFFSDGRCNQFHLTLDRVELQEGSNDDHDITKTICHELGHSVGLTHYKDGNGDFPEAPDGEQDCMISGEILSTDDTWIIWEDHHKDHINSNVG